MALRGWFRRGVGTVLVAVLLLLLGAQAATASSGSLSVVDASGRSMTVTAEATVDGCGYELCPWAASVRERHASLPCKNDGVFNVGAVGAQAQVGTVRGTLTFQPFFPRSAKLCLYVFQPLGGGTDLLAELTYRVPRGYGYRRSAAFVCSDFKSQSAAQYYLYLYPEDPSGLDPDGNGLACEERPCPCGAERIPAEPVAQRAICKKARNRERQAGLAVKVAERRLRKAHNPAATRRWSKSLKTRKAALRKAKRRTRKACRPPRSRA